MSDNDSSSQCLSGLQEATLAFLPIPAAILSILGSSVIIRIALNSGTRKRWSPYTRLLIGLSACDIFSSINVALSSFLRPTESRRATFITIGNATTCSISGLTTQVSYSAAFYSCMISLYFLLTARFRMKNSCIAKRIEPMMHFISLGYPLITAIVGAALGVYADTGFFLGCWGYDYPRNCGHEPGKSGEECLSETVGWIFFGWPFLIILFALIINNIVIWSFVNRQSVPRRQTNSTARDDSNDDDDEDDEFHHQSDDSLAAQKRSDDSFLMENSSKLDENVVCCSIGTPSSSSSSNGNSTAQAKRTRDSAGETQLRRLRLVKSQAFLFVASYAFVTMWGGFMAIAEKQTESEEEELSILVDIYPILVLNALFMPMQGFFNMLVYVRPTYMQVRHKCKQKSRWWAFKHAVWGDQGARRKGRKQRVAKKEQVTNTRKSPQEKVSKHGDIEDGGDSTNEIPQRRGVVSTLTASRGDFVEDSIITENDASDDRWGEVDDFAKRHDAWAPTLQAPRYQSSLFERGSSLQMISELTETIFDPIIDHQFGEREDAVESKNRPSSTEPTEMLSLSTADTRWSPSSPETRKKVRPDLSAMMMPQRIPSSSELLVDLRRDPISVESVDMPVRAPIRKTSLIEPIEEVEDDEHQSTPRRETPIRRGRLDDDETPDRIIRPPARRRSPTPPSQSVQ